MTPIPCSVRIVFLFAVALWLPPSLQAQPPGEPPGDPGKPTFRPDGLGFRQPNPKTEAVGRITSTTGSYTAPTYAPTVAVAPAYNPYGIPGYTYVGAGYGNSYAGLFGGVANVISAEGQFRIANEQSKVVAEQAKQAKLETKHKAIDEWLYERAVLPTFEDERARAQWEDLKRARNDPPKTEIWSATALNDLLSSINRTQRTGLSGPPVPISDQMLQHINFTAGTTYRGTGLLKDGGSLKWPYVLEGPGLEKLSRQADELVKQAVHEVSSANQASAKTIRELDKVLEALDEAVRSQAKDLTPTESIQARRYLRELKDSCAVFKQPDAGRYFTAKPKVGNVSDLIDQMNGQGLRFAPAVSGDEASYNALYMALVTYEARLSMLAPRQ